MDANKLTKLHEIDYQIPKVCGLCKHGVFASTLIEWGECSKHDYDHLKHSDSHRHLSIYRGGLCNMFEPNESQLERLNKFREFVR